MSKTTEEFIKQAKEKHGNSFDYSKTVYSGWDKDLTVICLVHGEFEVKPYNHLRSKYGGCEFCNPLKKLTLGTFIERAKKVYGDKYVYSETIIKNTFTKATIICKEHGPFDRYPLNFLSGQECATCLNKKERKMSDETILKRFLTKASKVHNNKYIYSSINLKKEKIAIECKEHGTFFQKPEYHLRGNGCPVCGEEQRAQTQSKGVEDFIKESKEIHGDKYDYSKVEYKNNKTKVELICPEHKEFWIKPIKHLAGHGCEKCAGRNKTTEEAIEEIERRHPGWYDLSNFVYVNYNTESEVVCKKHNHKFKASFGRLMDAKRKCCSKEWQSNPNLYIKSFLDSEGIDNDPEHTFPDCKYKKELLFDFWLPEYNTVIEYQGEWHFFDFTGSLEVQQMRDQVKRDYCKNKGIRELEIPYWEQENIDSIIYEFLGIK